MKHFIISILFLSTFTVFSQDDLDDIAIANNTYQQSSKELDSIFQEIIKQYANKTLFIQKLKKSQQAWKTYSALMLEMRYPDYNYLENQGDYNLCFADEINEITRKRIDELNVWLVDVDTEFEFDDCRGSIKIVDYENPNPDNEPVILFYYSKETGELEYNFSIRFDYVAFGYKNPNINSEKLFLLSIFTKDVENNPYQCKYGAYYNPSDFDGLNLKFDKIVGDFARLLIQKNNKTIDVIYMERKYFHNKRV